MRNLLTGWAIASLCVGLSAQSPLTTTFANNNGGSVGGAVYFDLTAPSPLTITGIDVNLYTAATTAGSVDIYMCPATYLGNEANPAVWTLIGSGAAISAGPGVPTALALNGPFAIPAGTNGFAYVGVGQAFAYTNGNGSNQSYATLELQLAAGTALNTAFSGTPFTPRVVNTSIHYVAGAGSYATRASFGTGCVEKYASFYELFTASFDLGNTSLQAIHTGTGYLVLPGSNQWYTPTSTPVTMGDDQVLPFALGWAFPYPGATTTDLYVSSNGFVHLTPSTNNGCCSGVVADLLSSTCGPRWAALWYDLNPSAGGAVYLDSDPVTGTAYVTFDQVPQYGTTNPNTFQYKFDQAGNVELRWGTCAIAASSILVGWSPGADNLDPGATDLSAITVLVTEPADVRSLLLTADVRPVLGTTVNLTIDNIPASALLSAAIFGFARLDPGMPLDAMGMQGCLQFASMEAVGLLFGAPSAVYPFAIPNIPAIAGLHVITQGASYAPAAGLTALGAVTSNGIDLGLDLN